MSLRDQIRRIDQCLAEVLYALPQRCPFAVSHAPAGVMLGIATEDKSLVVEPDGYVHVMWRQVEALQMPKDPERTRPSHNRPNIKAGRGASPPEGSARRGRARHHFTGQGAHVLLLVGKSGGRPGECAQSLDLITRGIGRQPPPALKPQALAVGQGTGDQFAQRHEPFHGGNHRLVGPGVAEGFGDLRFHQRNNGLPGQTPCESRHFEQVEENRHRRVRDGPVGRGKAHFALFERLARSAKSGQIVRQVSNPMRSPSLR